MTFWSGTALNSRKDQVSGYDRIFGTHILRSQTPYHRFPAPRWKTSSGHVTWLSAPTGVISEYHRAA
jgi:hypothetical protein